MSWPKVAILSLAILVGLVLSGGVYSVGPRFGKHETTRLNRFTGRIEVFLPDDTDMVLYQVLERGVPTWIDLDAIKPMKPDSFKANK